ETQKAAGLQAEMEALENTLLNFRIEIHQRVSADEQTHAGNRRIENQIVTAKNHRSSKVAIEEVPAVRALEMLRGHALGQRRDVVLRVRRKPSLTECFFVHVSRVDL